MAREGEASGLVGTSCSSNKNKLEYHIPFQVSSDQLAIVGNSHNHQHYHHPHNNKQLFLSRQQHNGGSGVNKKGSGTGGGGSGATTVVALQTFSSSAKDCRDSPIMAPLLPLRNKQ